MILLHRPSSIVKGPVSGVAVRASLFAAKQDCNFIRLEKHGCTRGPVRESYIKTLGSLVQGWAVVSKPHCAHLATALPELKTRNCSLLLYFVYA